MPVHSTNYISTFISVAEDCKKESAEVPPIKLDKLKSIARMQYEMITENPYKYTSDDIIFTIYSERKGITKSNLEYERVLFFSKGQPCFRSSPLAKTYGWGFHYDEHSRVGLVGMDDTRYEEMTKSETLEQVNAMRSKRK